MQLQVAATETFAVVPFEYVAVATKCGGVELFTVVVALAGVISNLVIVGLVTVNAAVLLVIPPRVAVILALPTATPVANPPDAIVAIDVALLLQVALLVTSPVVPL